MVIICNGIICKDIGKEFTAGQGAGEQEPRSATGSASHRRLQIPARQARSGLLVGRRMPARANVAGLAMLCAAAARRHPGRIPAGRAGSKAREGASSPRDDRKALYGTAHPGRRSAYPGGR